GRPRGTPERHHDGRPAPPSARPPHPQKEDRRLRPPPPAAPPGLPRLPHGRLAVLPPGTRAPGPVGPPLARRVGRRRAGVRGGGGEAGLAAGQDDGGGGQDNHGEQEGDVEGPGEGQARGRAEAGRRGEVRGRRGAEGRRTGPEKETGTGPRPAGGVAVHAGAAGGGRCRRGSRGVQRGLGRRRTRDGHGQPPHRSGRRGAHDRQRDGGQGPKEESRTALASIRQGTVQSPPERLVGDLLRTPPHEAGRPAVPPVLPAVRAQVLLRHRVPPVLVPDRRRRHVRRGGQGRELPAVVPVRRTPPPRGTADGPPGRLRAHGQALLRPGCEHGPAGRREAPGDTGGNRGPVRGPRRGPRAVHGRGRGRLEGARDAVPEHGPAGEAGDAPVRPPPGPRLGLSRGRPVAVRAEHVRDVP
ncbi:hypothetical protein THAOC_30727, partial [Thalassiosira oceanica]